MTREAQLAWVAGLLEGEGSFTYHQRGRSMSIRLYCAMTDLDVLLKLKELSGIGNITERRKPVPSRKRMWDWHASKRAEVIPFMESIKDYMGIRRRARIDELIQLAADYPPLRCGPRKRL